jgi:long-chain fatty acid transport protein
MKKSFSGFYAVVLAVLSLFLAPTAHATNGMNLEGYGPIATGMGGASMAYDNGTAAVMNNPATLGLMPDGNRLDVALGFLGPHIKSEMPGMPNAESSADAFYMPALGWVRKSGNFAYGAGVFSQGGMGTQYDATSFMALGSGKEVRSELGVGRVIIPLVYNVTPDLTVGGSIDYVWASLDLEMAATGAQLGSLVTSCFGGNGVTTGCAALPGLGLAPWARIDFTGGGSFNGAATGTGFAGKLGATYKINSDISIGATYHSKTSLSNLETKSNSAVLSAFGGFSSIGTIKVRDFQWPETYGVGVAWNATKNLMVAADIKRINWHDVMKEFKLTYESGDVAGAPTQINLALPQNWKDQTAYELGLGYKVSEPLTLRVGANIANNPIPNAFLNPLFPATIKNHYMIGAGYMLGKASSVDASFTYAPEVKVMNAQGITVTHYQTNAQVMYSYRF